MLVVPAKLLRLRTLDASEGRVALGLTDCAAAEAETDRTLGADEFRLGMPECRATFEVIEGALPYAGVFEATVLRSGGIILDRPEVDATELVEEAVLIRGLIVDDRIAELAGLEESLPLSDAVEFRMLAFESRAAFRLSVASLRLRGSSFAALLFRGVTRRPVLVVGVGG